MTDRHVIECELIADDPDADIDQIPMHHVVPRFGVTPGSIRTPAPSLGEHSREILARIGRAAHGFDACPGEGIVVDVAIRR